MATRVSITNEQTVEVGSNGPDDITRMYIVSGIANSNLSASSAGGGGFEIQSRTFEAHVGPSLTTGEFRRAAAMASLASLEGRGGDASFRRWKITDVDADYDDEEGKVQLRFELEVGVDAGPASASATIVGVGFQVVILAASNG